MTNKDWLKSYQLPPPEHYLYIVLRRWGDKYVVHVYNSLDKGYYYGVYCQTLEKAEQAYERKLAYYLGELLPEERPDNLMVALEEVRLTGLCNMADIIVVTEILETYNYDAIARYILDHRENYDDLLEELGEYATAHQPKSLAQQLAEEMDWTVIVD